MNTWNFRDEILLASHRWYWLIASFLLGALLGWLVGLIWPAPYRATLDLYVGLNAYRAPRDLYIAQVADEELRSLDDYKNWQMGQLNSLALSDAYLSETLSRLRLEDSAWKGVDIAELRTMLSIAWRNTGDWHFSALASTSPLAGQAVFVWCQVVTEKTAQAVDAARQVVVIDSQLSEISRTLVDLETRQALLAETNTNLGGWMQFFENQSPDSILTPAEHWTLLSQVTTASAWNLGWLPVLNAAPAFGAQPLEYQDWLLQVIALIEAELTVIPSEISALQTQHTELTDSYIQAAEQSEALSANLEVQPVKDEAPQIARVRPVGTLLLIGGLSGLLILMFGWLVKITRKTER